MLMLKVENGAIYFVCDDREDILIAIEYLASRHPKLCDDGMQVTTLEPNFKGIK